MDWETALKGGKELAMDSGEFCQETGMVKMRRVFEYMGLTLAVTFLSDPDTEEFHCVTEEPEPYEVVKREYTLVEWHPKPVELPAVGGHLALVPPEPEEPAPEPKDYAVLPPALRSTETGPFAQGPLNLDDVPLPYGDPEAPTPHDTYCLCTVCWDGEYVL